MGMTSMSCLDSLIKTMIVTGVGVGMALTSPDEEGEMATNALVVLQVIIIIMMW